jgi:lambda family phage tail tape measure protein
VSQNPPPVQLVLTARDETRAAIQSAVGGLEQLKGSASNLQGLLAGAAAAFAGLAAVQQFRNFVSAAAAMDDLAEKTGASVEKLSALAGVAKISGVSIDVVENSLTRLAKGLAGADEESKGAGNALAALGLKAEELKKLDTADALKRVADELNKYKDGAGKTALAIDLLGKSGAQALPYLKDLAETEKLVGKLTAEQAAQAENLEKNMVRLSATTTGAWKEFAAAVLPTVDTFIQGLLEAANKSGGLRDEIKRLAADGTLRDWAENAAIGVAYVVDAFKNIIGLMPVLIAEAKVFASGFELAFAKFKSQNMQSTERERFLSQIRKEKAEAENALGGAVAKFLDTTQFSATIRTQFAALRAAGGASSPDQKPGLDYSSRVEKDKAKAQDALKAIEGYVDGIREQLVGVTEGEFEKMRRKALDVFTKVDFGGLSVQDQKRFREFFNQAWSDIDRLDKRAQDAVALKQLGDTFDVLAREAQAVAAAVAGFSDAMSLQARDLQFELDMVGKLASERQRLTMLRKIDADAVRAIAQANAANPENGAPAEEIAKIYSRAEAAKAAVSDLNEQILTKSRDGFTGLQSAAGEYFSRITNDAQNFGSAFTNIMGSVENSFVELAKTGKFEFKGLVSSIIGELIRLEARRTITAPISAALAGAGGIGGLFSGLFGGGSSTASDAFNGFRPPGFAAGGRPDVGRISMVGENGPELFVPDIAGTVIPNHALGGTTNQFDIAIDARGADAGVAERIEQGVKRAVALSVQAVAAQANRGGSYARSVGRR